MTKAAVKANPSRADALATDIITRLNYDLGKTVDRAEPNDWLRASILAIRDHVMDAWTQSKKRARENEEKQVYYLSLEFLIGRLMRDAVSNLGLMDDLRQALSSLDVSLDTIQMLEPDAALGNGGLGRLAACFMESMATVDVPASGYGIRYMHGLFRQQIKDGWQLEYPETWLTHGNPWEFERREAVYEVGFGGTVEMVRDPEPGEEMGRCIWHAQEKVIAAAYDTPIVGWKGNRVNPLRLWAAMPLDPIRLDAFNRGDHFGALAESNRAETLTRVLYPADETPAGQELRLRQEFFFVSASLQDIIHKHLRHYGELKSLPDKAAIQLNDTHPAVAVLELMRLLIDVHRYGFKQAWDMTRRTLSYTNHTLLPEALESWQVPLFERLLPRHMQIAYAVNAVVLKEARNERGFNDEQIRSISLIDEGGQRRIRMGNLAFVGSHSINGVSALHTELMKQTVFADLHALYPSRINNKTNGITPRRWLDQCNPALHALIRDVVPGDILADTERLTELRAFAEDSGFQEKFQAAKRDNKVRLANLVQRRMGFKINPDALFDMQIKRIHEYKRQLLNVIETVALYDQIRSHPERDWVPRVKFFAGKAASSYHNAKLIIKLANDVARVVNSDPAVRGLLKVVFLPNYNVSLAEVMIPAADLSEQISTAGMEASGTSNMKFALNGALTIGTMDGANVEMSEHIGAENLFIFGLSTEEVQARRANGHNPREIIENSPELSQALAAIASGVFSPDDRGRFQSLVSALYDHDWFMVAADFDDYARAQRDADRVYLDRKEWNRKAILNTAGIGWFSSDRTIRQYASEIWGAGPETLTKS